MKAGRYFVIAAGLTAALALTIGCTEEPTGNPWTTAAPVAGQGDVRLARDVQFEDIPMPQEYVLNPNASYSFQGSQSRSGSFLYFGPLEWTVALDFFRTQMPQAGWIPGETERGYDFRVLHFHKGEEKLILTVRQLRSGSSAEVQLDNIAKNDLLLRGKLPATR